MFSLIRLVSETVARTLSSPRLILRIAPWFILELTVYWLTPRFFYREGLLNTATEIRCESLSVT